MKWHLRMAGQNEILAPVSESRAQFLVIAIKNVGEERKGERERGFCQKRVAGRDIEYFVWNGISPGRRPSFRRRLTFSQVYNISKAGPAFSLSLSFSSFFDERTASRVPLRVPLWSPVKLYWTSGRDWRISIIFYFVEIKGNLQLYGLRGRSLPRNIQSRRNFLVFRRLKDAVLLSFLSLYFWIFPANRIDNFYVTPRYVCRCRYDTSRKFECVLCMWNIYIEVRSILRNDLLV